VDDLVWHSTDTDHYFAFASASITYVAASVAANITTTSLFLGYLDDRDVRHWFWLMILIFYFLLLSIHCYSAKCTPCNGFSYGITWIPCSLWIRLVSWSSFKCARRWHFFSKTKSQTHTFILPFLWSWSHKYSQIICDR